MRLKWNTSLNLILCVFFRKIEDRLLRRKTEKMKFNYANIMLLQKIRYIAFIVLLFNLSILHSQTGLGIHTVVIDPGHGERTLGQLEQKRTWKKQ